MPVWVQIITPGPLVWGLYERSSELSWIYGISPIILNSQYQEIGLGTYINYDWNVYKNIVYSKFTNNVLYWYSQIDVKPSYNKRENQFNKEGIIYHYIALV